MAKKPFSADEITKGIESSSTVKNFKFKPRNYEFTPKQKDLIGKILDPQIKIIFVEGPAGSSKSIMAIYGALKLLKEDPTVERILYLRSAVEASHNKLGYMPGSAQEKEYHYMGPLYDKLDELLYVPDITHLITTKIVEGTCINFLRGASWRNQVIIGDESQDLSMRELQTVMTRIGENSKLILCGDIMQSDIKDSGFRKVNNLFSDSASEEHGISRIQFTVDDIVRSEIVKFVVQKFQQLY